MSAHVWACRSPVALGSRRGLVSSLPSLSTVHPTWPRLRCPGPGRFQRAVPPLPYASLSTQAAPLESVEESPSARSTVPVLLTVRNMKCGGCSAAVKRMLLQQPEISAAAVNLLTETAAIQIEAGSPLSVAERAAGVLTEKGFPATLRTADEGDLSNTAAEINKRREQELKDSTKTLAFAWTLAIACYGHHIGHFLHVLGLHEYAHTGLMGLLGNPVVSGVIGAAAILGPGRQLLVDGVKSLVGGTPNMNSLIALGASTSFTAGVLSAVVPGLTIDPSFLEEPVMLLAFVLLGRSLEARARANASMDLTTLAQLIPSSSRLLLDEGAKPGAAPVSSSVDEMMVPTSTVQAGDILRVLPGERFPIDGTILSGTCGVDESMLTGESKMVTKHTGDSVTGGTVAYEAPVIVQATCTGSSSTLSGIGRMVTEAQSREAPVQRLADVVAGWFCYGVMTASAGTFAFWYSFGTNIFPEALAAVDVSGPTAPLLLSVKLAIDVLVVACPCALGLATPTAVLVATSSGAKRGLLIRGGDVLEQLANVSTVVFDKTGTLTEGKLRLTGIKTFSDCTAARALQLAAAVESLTTHPLAVAVKQAAIEHELDIPIASSSLTEPGDGVYGRVGDEDVYVGRLSWVTSHLRGHHLNVPSVDAEPNGSTTVWIGSSTAGLVGSLAFADTLRPDAQEVVRKLHEAGKRVVMLSGDDESVARAVALEAGIRLEDTYGRIKPEEKARFVSQLRESGSVAMVGDGVNDAIALSAADVGVAMGGGSDAAGAASSVVLMGDRLGQVLEAINLGEATFRKIKQNLGLAVAYNIVGIPIAAGALLPAYGIAISPTVAAGMMACSSIVVVTNSLLLRQASK